MRATILPSGRKIVLSDTVGFISQLPTELIEAFKSTLEEVVFADYLLHVHDASSPLMKEESDDVEAVLRDIGLSEEDLKAKVIHVLNKADAITENYDLIQRQIPKGVMVSALTSEGIDDLFAAMETKLSLLERQIDVTLSPYMGDARAWLYRHGRVDDTQANEMGDTLMTVTLSVADYARFSSRWPDLV
ncbi:MAG: GTPase HflX, partial [Alphaproteobacteria bacterium]|nr:GTPase HflX [Alphaproteobacteria bacterium]